MKLLQKYLPEPLPILPDFLRARPGRLKFFQRNDSVSSEEMRGTKGISEDGFLNHYAVENLHYFNHPFFLVFPSRPLPFPRSKLSILRRCIVLRRERERTRSTLCVTPFDRERWAAADHCNFSGMKRGQTIKTRTELLEEHFLNVHLFLSSGLDCSSNVI